MVQYLNLFEKWSFAYVNCVKVSSCAQTPCAKVWAKQFLLFIIVSISCFSLLAPFYSSSSCSFSWLFLVLTSLSSFLSSTTIIFSLFLCSSFSFASTSSCYSLIHKNQEEKDKCMREEEAKNKENKEVQKRSWKHEHEKEESGCKMENDKYVISSVSIKPL